MLLQRIKHYLTPKGDIVIWVVILSLLATSVVTVYSSSISLAYKKGDITDLNYFMRHLAWIGIGLAGIIVVHNINYKQLSTWVTVGAYLLSIIALAATLIFGEKTNNAARWLDLGFISFQASEPAKLALVMMLAKLLDMRAEYIKNFKRGVLYAAIPIGLTCGLIVKDNLSTALLIGVVSVGMMVLGGVRLKHLIVLGLAAIFAALIYDKIFDTNEGRSATWAARIERFLSPDENLSSDAAFQLKHTKVAVATGGFRGKGAGKSTERYFLPNAFSDLIFAIICEEYGIYGPLFVLVLYLILFFRLGIFIRGSNLKYPAFLASGIILMFVVQAFVHIFVSVDLAPITGQTLPFVSWGGTAMLFNCLGAGIVLSVFRSFNTKEEEYETESEE